MSYFKLFVARELCILHLMSEIDIKLLIIEIEKRFLDIKIILSNLFEINKISIRERERGGRGEEEDNFTESHFWYTIIL